MPVLQIATLGIHANQRIEYVLKKRGADKLILIGTEKNKNDIDGFKEQYQEHRFPFGFRIVDPWNYQQILAAVLEEILSHKEYSIEFNISCGTPTMRVACHMAAVLIDAPVHFVSQKDDEIVGDLVTAKPIPLSRLTEPKRNILHSLAKKEGGVKSQRDLGTRVNLSVSSISKHLKELKAANFVKSVEDGNKKRTQITDLGRMILRLKETRKQRSWN